MKMNFKKIISVLSSITLTAALAGGVYSDTENKTSMQYSVKAEENVINDWIVDIFMVIVDKIYTDGSHCQWYTNDETSFRTKGVHVKYEGTDITSDSKFTFKDGDSPASVYDNINTDYLIPVNVSSDDYGSIDAQIPAKIGQEGDANLDHIVDVRDASAIVRDVKYYAKKSESKLDEFGLFLAYPDKDTAVYPLTLARASVIAKDLAKEAIKRATGKPLKGNEESEYAISLSGTNGLPGETVVMNVVVDADNTFESLDAVIEWSDETLASAGAVAVNGTLCETYVEDGMMSIVDYSEGAVKDGAIASLKFTIPQDAVPGTSLDVYFSDVKTFAVYENGSTSDVSDVVNVVGTSIKVNKPTQSTPAVTTAPSQPTVTTTTVSKPLTKPVEQGDANLDGNVDIRDAAYIAKCLAYGEGTLLPDASDFNNDDKKDVRDAAALAIYLAQKYV